MSAVLVGSGAWVAPTGGGGGDPGGGEQPLLTASDIEYLGYYALNISALEWANGDSPMAIRYVSGQPRLILSCWGGPFNVETRPVVEINLAGVAFGSTITTPVNTWTVGSSQTDPVVYGSEPTWQYGWSYQGPGYGYCESILWDSANGKLLRTSFEGYPGQFNQLWVDVLNVPTSGGSITRDKRVYIGTMHDGDVILGHSEIPAAFQSQFGVGPIALGTGGYRSKAGQFGFTAPLGLSTYAVPDLAGYADRATVPPTTLAQHTIALRGKRPYVGYTFTPTGTKTFTLDEVDDDGGVVAMAGVSVPSGTFTGAGPIDYYPWNDSDPHPDPRGNPANTSEPTWDPYELNPAGFGNEYGEVSPGETRFNIEQYAGHAILYGSGYTKRGVIAVAQNSYGKIWYSGSSIAVQGAQMSIHIFDPEHLGEVVQGSRAAYNVEPVEYRALTEITPGYDAATCVPYSAWDATAKRLYIWFRDASGVRIHVYQVNA